MDMALVLLQTHLDRVGAFCHLQLQSRILQTCQTSPGAPLHPGSAEPPFTRSELQTSTLMDLLDLLNLARRPEPSQTSGNLLDLLKPPGPPETCWTF